MQDRRLPRNEPVTEANLMGHVDGTNQQEVIAHFSLLLVQLGSLLESMIGVDATAAVLWSALLSARREHPVLHNLEIDTDGGHIVQLQANRINIDPTELQNSLVAYIDGIVTLVADITGEVLVLKIAPLIQQFQQRLEG
ncbi:hypothetical protein [Candidatus Entotheonella palauensis]|nr:hypothetical protein [Candidatus Entotheonella palauensis]